ncbi:MAG: hypothetical protein ACHQCI_02650 [Solirubrobacterales bacterium]|jgi:hypothetical protein
MATLLIPVVVAGGALALPLHASAHEARYASKVTLKDPQYAPPKRGQFKYSGKVTSESAKCVEGRYVRLFRKTPGSPLSELGNDDTDANGKWSMVLNVNMPGRLYAVVDKDIRGSPGHVHTCKSAQSDYVNFEPARRAKDPRFATELTMKEPHSVSSMPKRGTLRYGGKVKSDAHACSSHREVTLYRKNGPLPAEAIATDESDGTGRWFTDYDFNTAGKYYARVQKDTVNGKICLAAKSNVFIDET